MDRFSRILIPGLLLWGAASATGFLSVESSPGGAEVWYTGPEDPDRKYLGDTPLENRELSTGRYSLWLILPSHDTLAVPEVYIAEGQHTLVNREIPTHYGFLEVVSSPDSAEVWLDKVKAGTTPLENNLMLPATYALKLKPREAHFRSLVRKVPISKGDTVRLGLESPYRNKAFLFENLSITPWRLQVEAGVQRLNTRGIYDTAGKHDPASTDEKRHQVDFPIGARLGLPQGIEMHLLLPFKTYSGKDSVAPFPSNMEAGIKYTYRPFNVGADITYGLGIKDGADALRHDYLALTLLGMASKGRIVGQASAGFEFHFTDKEQSELDYGDLVQVHAQLGYLVDPWLPYLGLTAALRLGSSLDGEAQEDGGHLVIPEPGVILDLDDFFSLQLGVPFTILGKRDASYWGVHASFALSLGIL